MPGSPSSMWKRIMSLQKWEIEDILSYIENPYATASTIPPLLLYELVTLYANDCLKKTTFTKEELAEIFGIIKTALIIEKLRRDGIVEISFGIDPCNPLITIKINRGDKND